MLGVGGFGTWMSSLCKLGRGFGCLPVSSSSGFCFGRAFRPRAFQPAALRLVVTWMLTGPRGLEPVDEVIGQVSQSEALSIEGEHAVSGNGLQAGPDATWIFSIFNPTGLHNKVDVVATFPGSTWVASEIHLTGSGVRKFRTGLRALKPKFCNIVAGAPCEDKSGYDVGKHTGVMLLSDGPARALPNSFPDETF